MYGAHTASYPMGTRGFHPGGETDHSPPSSAEVEEGVDLYLHSPNTPSWRGAQLNSAVINSAIRCRILITDARVQYEGMSRGLCSHQSSTGTDFCLLSVIIISGSVGLW
jgi:hypothetical protein